MRARKLFWQIYPPALAVLILSLAVLAVLVGRNLQRVTYQRQVEDLGARAALIAPSVNQLLGEENLSALRSLLQEAGDGSQTRFTLIDNSGVVLADTEENPDGMDNHGQRPEILKAFAQGQGHSFRFSATLQKEMVYSALQLLPDRQHVLRSSIPLRDVQAEILEQQRQIFLVSLALLIVAALLSLWYTRRISQPIEKMRLAAEQYASGSLSLRLEKGHVDELNSLGQAMNRMATSLTEKVESLARERNMREALLDSMIEGVIGLDQDNRVLFLNRAACRYLRVEEEQVLAKVFPDCINLPELRNALAEALDLGGESEQSLRLPEEGLRHFAFSVTPLLDISDQDIGTLCVFNEVTRIRRLETVREDFVANVSHELRTPITSIRGFVETLRDGTVEDPATTERFLEIIHRQVVRMNAITDDLLELSQIEREEEQGPIERESTFLRPLAEMVLDLCQSRARAQGVRLQLECESGLQWSLHPHMLERALSNLVENAIKYSNSGTEVRLEVSVLDNELSIRVIDQGIGIPDEDLPRLFERFYVIDKARSRKLGGTGLGLSIVKHIAKAHQGRITVQSRSGHGSVFELRIPPVV